MVILRALLITMMVSGGAIFGMEDLENMSRQKVDINTLLKAVEKNDIELIESYINNGGNINAKGTIPASPYLKKIKEMTLLMTSAFYGRPKLMKILIENDAQLNCTNEFGDTALMMAARTGRTSLVKSLVKAGADKSIQNNDGKTALDEANSSLLRSVPFYNCTIPRRSKSGSKKLNGDSKNLKYGSRNLNFPEMITFLEKTKNDKTECCRQTVTTEVYPKKLMHNVIDLNTYTRMQHSRVPNRLQLLEWPQQRTV